MNYKSQLKAYSKQLFDPFCRKWKITKPKKVYCAIHFYYKKDKYIETTAGQLNFFRWVIQNNVLEYAIDKITDIQRDMLMFAKKKNRIINQNLKDQTPMNQNLKDQNTTNQSNPPITTFEGSKSKGSKSEGSKPKEPKNDEISITMTAVAIKTNDKLTNDKLTNDKNANRKIMKNQINITVDFN